MSFAKEVRRATIWPLKQLISHKTAIFRQVNKNNPFRHHDALEFPDGQVVLLTLLCEGQQATVLQLPAEPQKTRPRVPPLGPLKWWSLKTFSIRGALAKSPDQ